MVSLAFAEVGPFIHFSILGDQIGLVFMPSYFWMCNGLCMVCVSLLFGVLAQACLNTVFSNTYLHLNSEHTGLPGQTEDVVIAQPEVSADGSKSTFVLLPVTVERCQADLTPLNQSPATTICLHVTENLEVVIKM